MGYPEGFNDINIEKAKELIKDEKFIYLIGMIVPPRPGFREFTTYLEYAYFPPGTKKNEEFIMMVSNWENILWAIVGIPKEYMDIVKKVAANFNLKIVDGIPYMFSRGKTLSFPLKGNNLFTVENTPGHEIYKESLEALKKKVQPEEKKKKQEEKEEPKSMKIDWEEEKEKED